jgi:hypothetical protein
VRGVGVPYARQYAGQGSLEDAFYQGDIGVLQRRGVILKELLADVAGTFSSFLCTRKGEFGWIHLQSRLESVQCPRQVDTSISDAATIVYDP